MWGETGNTGHCLLLCVQARSDFSFVQWELTHIFANFGVFFPCPANSSEKLLQTGILLAQEVFESCHLFWGWGKGSPDQYGDLQLPCLLESVKVCRYHNVVFIFLSLLLHSFSLLPSIVMVLSYLIGLSNTVSWWYAKKKSLLRSILKSILNAVLTPSY